MFLIFQSLYRFYDPFHIVFQEDCFPRCEKTLNFISKEYIQKASQWCILNRKHSNIMISYSNTHYIDLYKKVYAPDEICYITNIFINNLQDEIVTTVNVANDATTFTNWKGMDYKFPSDKSLKNYTSISEEEVLYLINSNCLFGRKFNKECDCIGYFSNLFEQAF